METEKIKTDKGTIELSYDVPRFHPLMPYKVLWYIEQKSFDRKYQRFWTEEDARAFIKMTFKLVP